MNRNIESHKPINVTSVRLRKIESNNIVAIASVTLNEQLIINDIKVKNKSGSINIQLPNTEYAKKSNQFSIVPQSVLYNKIKNAIINKLNEY